MSAYEPVRRYRDVFSIDDGRVPVVVEYGWDYRVGHAIETVYALPDGRQISRKELPSSTLSINDREFDMVVSLARENPQLKDILSEPGLHYYAGFAYREATDKDCYERSRCVHMIVSGNKDGQRHVAHVIVDLMTRRVVHPFFYGEDYKHGPAADAAN